MTPRVPDDNSAFRRGMELIADLYERDAIELSIGTTEETEGASEPIPPSQLQGRDLLNAAKDGYVYRAQGQGRVALLKRERRAAGLDPVNAKRVYRLMKKSGLLLARHTGRRIPRAHDGTIMTSRSNERWCSDALEFTCWNGEIVRVRLCPGQP